MLVSHLLIAVFFGPVAWVLVWLLVSAHLWLQYPRGSLEAVVVNLVAAAGFVKGGGARLGRPRWLASTAGARVACRVALSSGCYGWR